MIGTWKGDGEHRRRGGGETVKANTAYETRREQRGTGIHSSTRVGANHPNAIIISSVFQPRIRRNYASPVGVVRLRSWQLETDDASGLLSLSLSPTCRSEIKDDLVTWYRNTIGCVDPKSISFLPSFALFSSAV